MHSYRLESGSNSGHAYSDNPWRAHLDHKRDHRREEVDLTSLLDSAEHILLPGCSDTMILSPSPPPPAVPAPPAMEGPNTTADPRIVSLKAMFPDFDDTVILSVLESTNYDHDRALDVLLGMNDPSFVVPPPPEPQPRSQPQSRPMSPNQYPNQYRTAPSMDAQRLSQEELDEQLARRLALEEEQLAGRTWPQGQDAEQTAYPAYQRRRGGRNGSPPQGLPQTQAQGQGQGGRDTMAEFQEGFNRIAESGKKTFTSLMSKVRAKMQEFEQGQGWSGSQSPPPGQASQPIPSSYSSMYPQQGAHTQPSTLSRQGSRSPPARTNTNTYTYPNPSRMSASPSSPQESGVVRLPANSITAVTTEATEPAQQASYYDPNARGYDLYGDGDESDEEIQIVNKTTTTTTADAGAVPAAQNPILTSTVSTTPQTQTETDISTSPPVTAPSRSDSLPSYPATTAPISNPATLVATSLSTSTAISPPRSFSPTYPISGPVGTGTRSGPPSGVDFSKLGLLPKRPISLVSAQPPPVTGAGAGADVGGIPRTAPAHSASTDALDREEPEFVENPFEDR